MNTPTDRIPVLVQRMTWLADRVVGLDLVSPTGAPLPPWDPGAHVDVLLPSGLVRQYSLHGSSTDPGLYQIAVLREASGRGGSKEIHGTALVGRELQIRSPRNHFPLVESSSYSFMAGGIGITPILPMIRSVAARGHQWSLLYGGRTRSSMAFIDELKQIHGGHIEIQPQDEVGLPDLRHHLSRAPGDSVFYCCGPEGLLRAVASTLEDTGRSDRLYVERFGSAASAAPPATPNDSSEFEVELRASGITITVPPDRSVLDVVSEVAPTVLSSCSQGYCGTCETRVIEGIPDHRDSLLSERDKASNETMLICVSRSKTPRLVLDL